MSESTELVQAEQRPEIDPYRGRKDAVDALTMKAYERASQLQLTPEEVQKMQAEFPDEAFRKGAAGKDALIYIEHAHLRDRLNEVFGPGQWAIIPRNRWTDTFTTKNGAEGVKVYVEAMLLIRGCFVAEAVGDMDYWPKNDSTNFGDAVEGAKTAALRRCSKELGIGLQAWKKSWCEGWWARNPTGRAEPRGDDTAIGQDCIDFAEALLSKLAADYRPRFLKWAKVESVPEITLKRWPLIRDELKRAVEKTKGAT